MNLVWNSAEIFLMIELVIILVVTI